jgi:hypothetical protein
MSSKNQITHLFGALLVPFAVQAPLLILLKKLEAVRPMPSWVLINSDYAIFGISLASGCFFLVRCLRSYAIPVAVLYLPGMYYLLMYFSIGVIGYVYGVSP